MNYDKILLQRFDVKVPDIQAGKITAAQITPQELQRYEEAKSAFNKCLGENQNLRGKALVKAAFNVHDELVMNYLKDHEIACKKGCAYCCHQLVCCSTLEMQLIIDFLNSLSRLKRREIFRDLKKKARNFYKKHGAVLSRTRSWESVGEYLKKALRNKPCIYLDKTGRKCLIYPVRPIVCRETRTKNPCGDIRELKKSPQEIKFFCDQAASDLIMREEEKQFGKMQIAPLPGWLISEQFGKLFF